MKRLFHILFWIAILQVSICQLGASSWENKTQHFRITVLNSGGDPQQGIILKVLGYSTEYVSDEQGLIDFEQTVENNYTRTASLYLPTDKNRVVKTIRLDESAQDTILRIDRPEDLAKYKQSGKTFPVNGVVMEGNKPIPHAEISIQGTGRHTFSDPHGAFSIDADYSHMVMIRAEKMENKYLDIETFLSRPDQPLEIRMTRKGADRIYNAVEIMPEYPGGMKAFFNYIKRKAHTTELAEKTKKEGAVMIQFVVEKDGSITSPSIVRGLDARLDTAALDAIRVMPDWIPAKDHGINVRCKYSVPVPFKRPKPTPPSQPTTPAKKTEQTPKDSLRTHMAPSDSLKTDSLPIMKPLTVDSLKMDSLKTDTTLVAKSDTLTNKQSVQATPSAEATEVKPKKRNFLVRFFRWLFGIKDKETPIETPQEESVKAVHEGMQPAVNKE